MLKIRPEQMQAFDDKSLRDFEDEMWEHCQEFAPQMCKVAKESAVRKVIQHGISQAESWGFTNRGPVRFYIELMFTFGSHFDIDPQHRLWTMPMRQQETLEQTSRADRLFESYSRFADVTMGKNNAILAKAIKRILNLKEEALLEAGERGHEGVKELFRELYPERYLEIGAAQVDKTIESAISNASALGADSKVSKVISFGLTLMIGHTYNSELLYPWVSNTFEKESGGSNVDDKFLLVYEKAKVYLRNVVEVLGA